MSSPPTHSAPTTPRKAAAQDGRFDLTPRSRIKAMLKQFDDESDDDVAGGAEMRKKSSMRGPSPMVDEDEEAEDEDEEVVSGRRGLGKKSVGKSVDSDNDDDEGMGIGRDDILKPRRPAWMDGDDDDADEHDQEKEEEDDDEDEAPVAPIRQRKLASPPPPPQNNNVSDDDEVMKTPKRSRIRKGRKDPFSQKDSDEESSESDAEPTPVKKTSPLRRATSEDAMNDGSDEEDADLPKDPNTNTRLKELVEKKRRAALEKEAEEELKRQERREREERDREKHAGSDDGDDDEGSMDEDDEGRGSGRRRPQRSAGKKALEEMARETQRMARNMQLAHEAKTKVRIGKQSLFDKFNFKPANTTSGPPPKKAVEAQTQPQSKPVEEAADVEMTAPALTSEPAVIEEAKSTDGITKPELATPKKLDKGKGKAIDPPTPRQNAADKFQKMKISSLPKPVTTSTTTTFSKAAAADSDSDIELIDPIPKAPKPASKPQNPKYAALQARKLAILEEQNKQKKAKELAAKEAAILELRKRSGNAGPKSPFKPKAGPKRLNAKQLAAELLQKSRQQAVEEREERVNELKAKGIIVMTAEERARDMATVEEQMEKARLDAERLKKKEQKEIRLEKIKNGEKVDDELDDEDEEDAEDGDWLDDKQGILYELSGSEEEGAEEAVGSGEEEGSVSDFSDLEKGSGSEAEEGVDDGGLEDEEDSKKSPNAMVDDEAEEDDDNDDDTAAEQLSLEADRFIERAKKPRRKARVIEDEEDDDEDDDMDLDDTPASASKNPFAAFPRFDEQESFGLTQAFDSTMGAPASESKNPFAAFPGFSQDSDEQPPMGLTQMFAGTIGAGESTQPSSSISKPKGVSALDRLRRAPVGELPNSQEPINFGADYDAQFHVKAAPSDMDVDLQYVQSQSEHGSDSEEENRTPKQSEKEPSFANVNLAYSQSQINTDEDNTYTSTQSQYPSPTPDQGFSPPPFEEAKRFGTPPPSTIVTEVLATQGSPQTLRQKPRRRLRRPGEQHVRESSNEDDDGDAEDEKESQANAFAVMRKAAKLAKRRKEEEDFDRKNSEAKKMVDEQAEESEDEWAGVGGASDDDELDNMDNEELAGMIDDSTTHVDENAIKAYYAEKERKDDERHVTKLFRDLQNGGLRRKRNADFDLSDSDDEEERRRAVRRRNEARMRKLILEDKNVSQIASNPKRAAFLQCLEDNDGDEAMGFLDQVEDDLYADLLGGSQTGEKEKGGEAARAGAGRSAAAAAAGAAQMDVPASQEDSDSFAAGPKFPKSRVGARGRKNPGLAEIRETLAFLVEEDEMKMLDYTDSEDEEEGQEGGAGGAGEGTSDPKRSTTSITSHSKRRTTTVIDRIQLRRTNSLLADSNSTGSTSTKLAFATADIDRDIGFRVPTLLRRATNNSQLSDSASSSTTATTATTSTTTTTAAGNPPPQQSDTALKKGGTASSSINYYQRESHKKEKVVDKLEGKRKLRLLKESKKRAAAAAAVGRNGGGAGGAGGAGAAAGGVVGLLAKGSFT